jgi:hypothetical protein
MALHRLDKFQVLCIFKNSAYLEPVTTHVQKSALDLCNTTALQMALQVKFIM